MSYASAAIKRLSNEYRHLQKEENRVSDFFVAPLEENIFEWHFTLRGPAGDDNNLPYRDGLYHGALLFSRSYPLEPPDIMFFTRSGRFATHEKICSTISSFHKELWQPTYDVALTLTALRHFMAQEEEFGIGAFPKNMVAVETKVAWAKESRGFTCSSCGCATLEVWETKMMMYPETSAEKTALVPKLPPSSTSAPSAAAAASTPDAEAEAEAGTTTTAVAGEETATPAPAETASEKKATVEAEAGRAVSGTPANTVEATPAAVVAPAATTAPSPPLKAVSASVPADLHTRASPLPPAAAVTESAPAAPSPPVPPAASASAQDRQTDGMGQHTSDVHRSDQEDATAAHAWQSASFHYAAYDYGNAYDDDDDEEDSYGLDEDGYPRCYLTSLPLLNEEEARQLANADMSSGIPDIRFEPVLRAAIRRDEHERAVAAALAAGDAPPPPPPPPPTPPGMFPGSHEMLPEELLAHLLPLHAQEDLVTPLIAPEIAAAVAAAAAEAAAEQRQAPPPPPQLAENLVFAIHTYRVSVPLRLVDRAILWSFAVAVFILLRRAVWSFVMGMWS